MGHGRAARPRRRTRARYRECDDARNEADDGAHVTEPSADFLARAGKAREIVATLAATTRFAGSDDESRARDYCRGLLEQQGFRVDDQPFEFSKAPALWGPSLTAALAAAAVWTGAHFATRHHAPLTGLSIAFDGLLLIGALAIWAAKVGVLGLPWQKSASVNLVAVPRSSISRPEIWLSAHLDSKSQTIPMLVRVASTVLFALFSAAVLVAIFTIPYMPEASPAIAHAATVLSWLAVVAALPIILCFISNKSNGALDNATGVASVILAAEQIGQQRNVGVVITSGEELGLAGARHFAAAERTAAIAINCDTIDDDGSFRCMASGRRAKRLSDAIDRASNASLRITPMIPGIIADNVAFSAKGWESFTLSRGNIGTLAHVHTPRDLPDRLKGTGIAQASSLIAAIVEELA